ncbi:MAG: TonB-dependent receptor [Arcobacteraceae bacterium]|jgi:iron complex outermembrane receptor protein|nr:TonB-dependent receptor [Arcobacteraceae bacterium]
MRFFIFYTIVFSIFNTYLFADDIEKLFKDANNFTNSTNLNIDYQPSVLTVLYASDLEALGISTLSEALDFVPGLQTMTGTSNISKVVIRGNTQPYDFVFEKIKFFINGLDVNYYYYYTNFPISLIDRIEVLRGGASALYGQNAYSGAINIVTKSTGDLQNSINLGAGSFNQKNASAVINKTFGDWKLGIDAYYFKNDKKVDAPSGKTTATSISNYLFTRDKESLEGNLEKSIGIILKNDNWSLNSRYTTTTMQNGYGSFGLIDFNEEGSFKFTTLTSELAYKTDISEHNKMKSTVGILRNNAELNTYFYKYEPNNFGLYDPHYQYNYTKQTLHAEISLINNSIDNHEIEIGAYFGRVFTLDNDFSTNADAIANIGLHVGDYYVPISNQLTTLSGSTGFVRSTGAQSISSYYLQDTFHFNDALDFSFNVRMDDYEFFDKVTSLRFASVYSLDNTNIFKFILSKSYRIPSLIEKNLVGHIGISGNQNIKPENTNTAELAYIYTTSKDNFKINTYYSICQNAIDLKHDGLYNNTTFQYYNNSDDQKNYGLELEYTKKFENRSKLLFNASYSRFIYTNKELNVTEANTPTASQITADLGYIYPLNEKLTFSGLAKYYGTKQLVDTTNTIEPVLLCNLTIQYRPINDVKLMLSGKNIFNQNYYYYGYNTIDGKMLREGTTWFLNMSYDF